MGKICNVKKSHGLDIETAIKQPDVIQNTFSFLENTLNYLQKQIIATYFRENQKLPP